VSSQLPRITKRDAVSDLSPDRTAQQYFEGRFVSVPAIIASACLTYLMFDVFGKTIRDDAEMDALLKENPLLDYSARNWGYHIIGPAEETNKDIILKFLQDKDKVSIATQVLLIDPTYRSKTHRNYQRFPKGNSGLHLASYFGLQQTVQSLLEIGAEADARDSHNQSPLSWAARNGHEGVVELLVQRSDVDVNSKDSEGRTPLSWATENGYGAVEKLLKEHGAAF
jgi:hypothetical protein